ncbi:MAG: 50S ribosomal protein L7/L12 [Endomicrobium sp.]|jgi:large subunit ribosomal protein L7/L12|nr:50S ribosomal protein L7/L12 [Endomicrobium sp.]
MAEFSKDKLIDIISSLSVLELSELVKALENKFGIVANQQVFTNSSTVANNDVQNKTTKTEQTEFDIILTNIGNSKINVIKIVREITNLGLKESKDLVEGAPKLLKAKVSKTEAEEIKKKLNDVGAIVEFK